MEDSQQPLDPDIISYYEGIDEAGRLFKGRGQLEMARSQEIIERHLPVPACHILDVGGGPGVYSCWLAREGYEVHLIDPVEKHLRQAREASSRQRRHPIASVSKGDARLLDRSDANADVMLLLGPLYHLTSRNDRVMALREAHRVLRPGGLVFCAVITRFASLLGGLVDGAVDDPHFMSILKRDLAEGQHRNPKYHPQYFTTAFFHHSFELESEVREADFSILELVSVEGPVWLAKDFEKRWADTTGRTQLLELVRTVEHDPTLMEVSPHIMVVGRK